MYNNRETMKVVYTNDISTLKELDLSGVGTLRLSMIPKDSTIEYLLGTCSFDTLSVQPSASISKSAMVRLQACNITIVRERFKAVDKSRYQSLSTKKLQLRQLILAQKSLNQYIYELGKMGSMDCMFVWRYLCLEEGAECYTGPSKLELTQTLGLAYSVSSLENIIAVIAYTAPHALPPEYTPNEGLVNRIRMIHHKYMIARQYEERLQSWEVEYGTLPPKIQHELHNDTQGNIGVPTNPTLKCIPGDLKTLHMYLKIRLLIKRYRDFITVQYADVLALHILQGKSFLEIADKYNLTKQAIHMRYHKALQAVFMIMRADTHPRRNSYKGKTCISPIDNCA